MKSHYPDAGSAYSAICHQYGISVLVPPGADPGFFLEGVHH